MAPLDAEVEHHVARVLREVARYGGGLVDARRRRRSGRRSGGAGWTPALAQANVVSPEQSNPTPGSRLVGAVGDAELREGGEQRLLVLEVGLRPRPAPWPTAIWGPSRRRWRRPSPARRRRYATRRSSRASPRTRRARRGRRSGCRRRTGEWWSPATSGERRSPARPERHRHGRRGAARSRRRGAPARLRRRSGVMCAAGEWAVRGRSYGRSHPTSRRCVAAGLSLGRDQPS